MSNETKNLGNDGIFSSPAVTNAKRALSFGKTYTFFAIFITLVGISISHGVFTALTGVLNISSEFAIAGTTLTLIEVPFGLTAALMLVTPIVILFVDDKNNGVLEYFLSLGMTQRDIYMRYLKAALLIVSLYLVLFIIVNFAISYTAYGAKNFVVTSTVLFLVVIIALSVVAFMITMLMIFSSLQKSRGGGNQPLALAIGSAAGVFPTFIFSILLPYNIAVIVEIGQATLIAIAFFGFFLLSEKLVKREKFLP